MIHVVVFLKGSSRPLRCDFLCRGQLTGTEIAWSLCLPQKRLKGKRWSCDRTEGSLCVYRLQIHFFITRDLWVLTLDWKVIEESHSILPERGTSPIRLEWEKLVIKSVMCHYWQCHSSYHCYAWLPSGQMFLVVCISYLCVQAFPCTFQFLYPHQDTSMLCKCIYCWFLSML